MVMADERAEEENKQAELDEVLEEPPTSRQLCYLNPFWMKFSFRSRVLTSLALSACHEFLLRQGRRELTMREPECLMQYTPGSCATGLKSQSKAG